MHMLRHVASTQKAALSASCAAHPLVSLMLQILQRKSDVISYYGTIDLTGVTSSKSDSWTAAGMAIPGCCTMPCKV